MSTRIPGGSVPRRRRTDAAEEWGRLDVPDPLPVIDGLLAACAKIRGWTLVTRNTADLARGAVTLLNPFDHPSAT
jgi:toxin FitB